MIASYTSGGYYYDLNFSQPMETVLAQVNALQTLGFIDDVTTRLVDVNFYVYNPAIDLFVGFDSLCEIPYGGTWLMVTRGFGFEVFTPNNQGELAFEIIFFFFVLGFIVLFIVDAVYEIRHGRWLGFVFSAWNFIEAVNLTIFMIMYGYLFNWMLVSQRLNLSDILVTTSYSDTLAQAETLYETMVWYNAINTILTFLKLLKYVRLNERLNLLTRTLSVAQQSLFGVFALFVYVVFAFALAANNLYGTHMYDFRSLGMSYLSLLRALIGDIDYTSMSDEALVMTVFFFWAFLILGQFILLNFFVAVITDGFREINRTTSPIPLDQAIVKAFNDARYEFLPETLKWKFLLLRHRYTQTGLIRETLNNLLEKRLKMVDAAAAQRGDFDEVEDVRMRKEDFDSMVPDGARVLLKENRTFLNEVWKDMTWEYHHKQLAQKGQDELEREKLVYEEVEQALRQLISAFPQIEQIKNRLHVQEAKLRPIARAVGLQI
jgi:hypothetical protein